MIQAINLDRQSTIRFLKRGREEGNPFIGNRPHRDKLNGLIALVLLIPFMISSMSPAWKASIYDTIAFNAQMSADRNNALADGESIQESTQWPYGFGLVITWRR
jgi:hypothetical protein